MGDVEANCVPKRNKRTDEKRNETDPKTQEATKMHETVSRKVDFSK